MKLFYRVTLVFIAACALSASTRAQTDTVLVSNTWNTGVRTYPAAPTYSEMGTDSNGSGDLESAWFNAGNAMTATSGHLTTTLPTNGTSSASWTTYFTPEASPVTLANAGDALKITWVFTPSNVNASSTSSSGLRLAVVDSPSTSRLTSDASPGSTNYAGYGMFMNMKSGNLGASSAFQLMKRAAPTTSSALLSASGSWTAVTNGANTSTAGYASGTQYTYVMTLTLNGSGGLDVSSVMSGTGLGTTNQLAAFYTDATPNSLTFDTFSIRPSSSGDSASLFDTTLFKAEFITVPEPSTLGLAGLGLALMIPAIRRRRAQHS